ncbi:exodeoxyribonuclease VII large subunit [Edaphobacter dinghuensis]|uniref:Exodeoxyribonuclease 7 large subunit n=1 Tax=Edaphobacter dinghuensis TaxID=1560005 RepID=A0A917M5G2_9BACT|nr:exodeoxyribonuclease VII large subunit [Edaphobacter dinghuensis]GGG79239.1 exodeoxyribonuclease 7 large subunit [Edaphobacter dinghuensis]
MGEKEEKPPTLASLRAGRGRTRLAKPIPIQTNLLFTSEPVKADTQPAAPRPAFEDASRSNTSLKPIDEPTPSLPTQRRIWSVRDLVIDIRQQVEGGYPDLWVEGEISNFRAAPSGHIYFTLKDGEAQLPVVLFRRQATLLRFRPADGLAVLVRGRISIYESRGQLQLIAETLEPRGAGALQLAFEQLKARLLAEGLFDADRKRPLPAFPHCVGIITSPSGAVIRDIVNVTRRRHARLNLLVYPATMQGTTCCSTVAAGIRYFNENPSLVDIIVLARGGGSIEDLSGFNDESLARAIDASEIPIVSAIGHETDFTIADFVADLRAPTPSAAAELVTAAQHRIEERIDALMARIHRAGRFHILSARQRYARLSSESVLNRLRDSISRRDQRIDELSLRLEAAATRRLRINTQRLATLTERLRRQNISIRIAATQRRLQTATERLLRTATRTVSTNQARLSRSTTRLEALSPLAVLSRGYALVYAENGILLRSAADTSPGETIRARLAEGTLTAKVSDNK